MLFNPEGTRYGVKFVLDTHMSKKQIGQIIGALGGCMIHIQTQEELNLEAIDTNEKR